MFLVLREYCDWEGEAWRFIIKEKGNKRAIEFLKEFVEEYPVEFSWDSSLETIDEVKSKLEINRRGATSYLNAYYYIEKLDKDKIKKLSEKDDWEPVFDEMYKGGI